MISLRAAHILGMRTLERAVLCSRAEQALSLPAGEHKGSSPTGQSLLRFTTNRPLDSLVKRAFTCFLESNSDLPVVCLFSATGRLNARQTRTPVKQPAPPFPTGSAAHGLRGQVKAWLACLLAHMPLLSACQTHLNSILGESSDVARSRVEAALRNLLPYAR